MNAIGVHKPQRSACTSAALESVLQHEITGLMVPKAVLHVAHKTLRDGAFASFTHRACITTLHKKLELAQL